MFTSLNLVPHEMAAASLSLKPQQCDTSTASNKGHARTSCSRPEWPKPVARLSTSLLSPPSPTGRSLTQHNLDGSVVDPRAEGEVKFLNVAEFVEQDEQELDPWLFG